jgi:hypothetical protein
LVTADVEVDTEIRTGLEEEHLLRYLHGIGGGIGLPQGPPYQPTTGCHAAAEERNYREEERGRNCLQGV